VRIEDLLDALFKSFVKRSKREPRERERLLLLSVYTFHYGRIDPATTTLPPNSLCLSTFMRMDG
jgi:hypothetical protein